MKLKLQFPPEPAFAAKHAEVAVTAVKEVKGQLLDYSPESLNLIDLIIQKFRIDGLSEDQISETVFSFGCYAGEVFVRHKSAKWVNPKDVMPADIAKNFPPIGV